MFKKMVIISIILMSSISYFNCQKNSKSITGVNEADTTNNGGLIVRKPNIYIYPTEKIDLTVRLKFPNGGKIIDSSPKYLNGWNIQVNPSGVINNQYQYLFYEARIPEILQRRSGWLKKGEDLEYFFEQNLSDLSFSEKEILDFLEYWIPLFEVDKIYIIYPHYSKELSDIIEINFSIPPDNIIRVLYLIEEFNGNNKVPPPKFHFIKETVLQY